jgi:hypothetical protein
MATRILIALIVVGLIYARHKVNRLHHTHRFMPVAVSVNLLNVLHVTDQNNIQ